MKPILRSLINQAIRAKSILQTGRTFHATIALKGSKVIAIGYNNYTRLHPYARFGKYASYKTVNYNHVIGLHSEIACVNYSPDELVSLIYMFKSILDTSLLMLVKSLADLSSLISAPCL